MHYWLRLQSYAARVEAWSHRIRGRTIWHPPPRPPLHSQKARYLAGILSCLDASITQPITTTRTSSPGSAGVTPCLTYGGTELQRGRGERHASQAQLFDSEGIRQFLSVSQRRLALWPLPGSGSHLAPCSLFQSITSRFLCLSTASTLLQRLSGGLQNRIWSVQKVLIQAGGASLASLSKTSMKMQ